MSDVNDPDHWYESKIGPDGTDQVFKVTKDSNGNLDYDLAHVSSLYVIREESSDPVVNLNSSASSVPPSVSPSVTSTAVNTPIIIDKDKRRLTPLAAEFYDKKFNSIRRAKLSLFDKCLSAYLEYQSMTSPEKMNLIQKLERSCLNTTVLKAKEENIPPTWNNYLFQEIYHSICYKISSNLEADGIVKNPRLALDIIRGKLNIFILPRMSSQDLFPDKYAEIIEKIERSKNATHTVKTSAMYKCRRCFKTECTIDNRYSRSLDEGVMLEIQCRSCHLTWNA